MSLKRLIGMLKNDIEFPKTVGEILDMLRVGI